MEQSGMIGRTISHYEILARIGQGGMGVVYKARDRRLDRIVALKVLKPREDNSAARFEQEAKTISALSHPHIAMIHDRGEVDGKPFLVFEYLSGGTVREKLRSRGKNKPLPLDDVLRYATEAAQGLAYAHRRGVVHRDVKSDNLMLTDEGRVKVTDFGLAKWAGGARITGYGETMGTASYMSPEQAQGAEVDQRSDIFSFGIVLYELLTGETPFQGLYPAAVVYDIIHTPMPSLRTARPDVPEALERIVQKATAKDPKDRYQTMDELLADLRTLHEPSGRVSAAIAPQRPADAVRRRFFLLGGFGAAALLSIGALFRSREPEMPSAPARPPGSSLPSLSIAVLPLENLSRDPAKDYLADGMTEALITVLAKIPTLRVISRTSVMRYKQNRKPLPEIASELNVDRIVEGSVLQVGNEIRITAQLIDARTDEHIWADSYQRNFRDVLALQQEVAKSIADEVKIQLSARDRQRLSEARPVDPEAYEAYLRGQYHAFQWRREDVLKGIDYYKRAISLDPNYGAAYAGLAMAYGFMSFFGGAPPHDVWPLARAAAEKALEIDESLDDAHTALGFVQATYDWNWRAAEREYRRALELTPNSSTAYHGNAMTCLAPLGRLDEAAASIERARDLDPLSVPVSTSAGGVYYFRREYNSAIQQLHKALEMDADFPEAHLWLANVHIARGAMQDAAEIFRKVEQLSKDSEPLLPALIHIAAGDGRAARGELRKFEERPGEQSLLAYSVGYSYALLGERDRAFEWLERAFQSRSSNLIYLKVSPLFDSLRSDPRFESLLRRMNLAD